jgi:hypothetical protein
MSDTGLQLDAHTERQLCDLISDVCHSRGFSLRDGAVLHLRETQAKEKGVADALKTKLAPYIDFEGGGLKLYEFDHRGQKGTFSLKPGWDKGGPTLMLQFHMRF